MKRSFRISHTLALLFAIMAGALVATWLLPQGEFQTSVNDAGNTVVVPGTYQHADERTMLSPLTLFTVVPRAMAASQDIIFFVLIVGGALAVLRASGLIDAVLGWTLKRVGHSPKLLIVIGMSVFAIGSGTIGVAEEYIPFAAMLITLCLAMRMDVITAMGILIVGYGIGYGVAVLNPFTVIVAQTVSGLEPGSGAGYRLALFVPFLAIGVHHVWSYARKVQADPDASLMKGIEPLHVPPSEYPPLDGRRLVLLVAALGALGLMIWGISMRGWYLVELGALFVGLAVFTGLAGGLGVDGTARRFGDGAAELAMTALLIGFARAIALILEEGVVLHTIVDVLATPLSLLGPHLGAVGMMFVQMLINLFIPSGSGQAFVTMPIMAPLADLVGIGRQTAVLAFQFGDGFANMLFPTNVILMSILGIAGILYDRWVRFVLPLYLKMLAAGSVALVVSVAIGYQ